MPPVVTTQAEASAKLSQLVDRAAAGEEIVIAKDGVPRARLVALPPQPMPRMPGGWEGQVTMSDDFDAALLPDLSASSARPRRR